MLLSSTQDVWGDLCGPLSTAERCDLVRRSRNSRPGPSFWKLAFLPLLPQGAQDAYWRLVDVQRRCGLVARRHKQALQINLPKVKGFRPLTMLGESMKAVDGPVARRRVRARSKLPNGAVYSPCNLAGESGQQAAAEVLYVDCLVCEDALEHCLPFCRFAVDYEKLFNTLQLGVIDAVDEFRGIPDPARRLAFEAFSGVELRVQTRWGESEVIRPTRGVPQGSVSGPELSKPGQEPILRLRDSSRAKYTTSAGRQVACTGFVDDDQHYGSGVLDLLCIRDELGCGSRASGIGFSWAKCAAYASGWDASAVAPDEYASSEQMESPRRVGIYGSEGQ